MPIIIISAVRSVRSSARPMTDIMRRRGVRDTTFFAARSDATYVTRDIFIQNVRQSIDDHPTASR